MEEPRSLEGAWRALGEQLAAYRKAAGCSQFQFADLAGYSRSTIANVETGRQHAPADFWRRADEILDAGGRLAAASEEIAAAAHQEHRDVAQRARPVLLAYAGNDGTAEVQAGEAQITRLVTKGAGSMYSPPQRNRRVITPRRRRSRRSGQESPSSCGRMSPG